MEEGPRIQMDPEISQARANDLGCSAIPRRRVFVEVRSVHRLCSACIRLSTFRDLASSSILIISILTTQNKDGIVTGIEQQPPRRNKFLAWTFEHRFAR